MSKLCLMFVPQWVVKNWAGFGASARCSQIQTLSRVCPCPNYVLGLSPTWVCPDIVQLQNFNTVWRSCWTISGQTMDLHVQSLSKPKCVGQRLDRHCTFVGQHMDIPCTWTDIGQTVDRPWTKIGFLVQEEGQWKLNRQRDTLFCQRGAVSSQRGAVSSQRDAVDRSLSGPRAG